MYRQWVHQFTGRKKPACSTYKTLGDEPTEAGLSRSYYRTADSKHPIVDTWDAYGWNGGSGCSPR